MMTSPLIPSLEPVGELPCEVRQRLGQRVLVAGCGYLGLSLARLLHAKGWEVTGITRTEQSAQTLATEPFRVIPCDLGDQAALARLGAFDAVVHCASSGRGGEEVYQRVYWQGMRHLLEVVHPTQCIFTGSTSVYAQQNGTVVTEESLAEPERNTGRILRQTENLMLAAGGIVARLAGIYGPGRWVLLEKFLAGNAVIEGDGSRWMNQIHRADAASALGLLLEKGVPSGIYNVVDNSPVRQIEVYEAFAAHFQRPVPPKGVPNLNRKRGWTSKQVSNGRLRALGWNPLYPSFRETLANISPRGGL